MKKNNKASSLNNYSINSNSQSNNHNLNHVSTNCSIGPFNKDNKKLIKKKTKESSKNKYNQNESKKILLYKIHPFSEAYASLYTNTSFSYNSPS